MSPRMCPADSPVDREAVYHSEPKIGLMDLSRSWRTETRWSNYQEINIAPSILDSEADNQLSGL
jgi:hypothetical protein